MGECTPPPAYTCTDTHTYTHKGSTGGLGVESWLSDCSENTGSGVPSLAMHKLGLLE